MFHSSEGALLKGESLKWCHGLKNLVAIDLGHGIHFVQETCPHRVGTELSKWYAAI